MSLVKKLSIVLALLLCLPLAACGDGAGAAASGAGKLKVGYLHAEIVDVAIWAGIESGAFERQGLELEMIQFDDGPALNQALVSGAIDVGVSGAAMMANVAAQGQAQAIGALWVEKTTEQVIALPGRGIESIEDLKGKKVSTAVGTSAHIILHAALKDAGMADSDVKIVNSSVSGAAASAISGAVDATAVWVPHAFRVLEKHPDAVILATGADFFPELAVGGGMAANKSVYADRPDDLEAFVAGGIAGAAAAVGSETVREAVWEKRYSDVEDLDDFQANWETADYPTVDEWRTYLDDGTLGTWLEGTQEMLVELGGLDSVNAFDDFFDTELFDSALDRAAKDIADNPAA